MTKEELVESLRESLKKKDVHQIQEARIEEISTDSRFADVLHFVMKIRHYDEEQLKGYLQSDNEQGLDSVVSDVYAEGFATDSGLDNKDYLGIVAGILNYLGLTYTVEVLTDTDLCIKYQNKTYSKNTMK